MSDFTKDPKSNYIKVLAWAELYKQAQHWKSDILLKTDELNFFRSLMDNYFVLMTGVEHIDTVRELEMDLLDAVRKCENLLPKVRRHLNQLSGALENYKNISIQIIRIEHEDLENDIFLFAQKFKTVRRDAIAVTEYIIDSEQFAALKYDKTMTNVA